MKNIFCTLLLVVALFSCKEVPLKVFGDEHHIYFDKFYMDANFPGKEKKELTEGSFFFLPEDQMQSEVHLLVHMTGRLLTADVPFGLKVVEDMTTATPDMYELDEMYIFKANNVDFEKDKNQSQLISIKIKKTNEVIANPDGYQLTVELVPLGDLQLGQLERRRAIIHISNHAFKPKWWDKDVEEKLFGAYSSRKYRLFLLNIPGAYELDEDMLANRTHKVYELLFAYKKWLKQNPTLAVEEDGTPITINI